MKKLLGAVLLLVILVGAYFFVQSWKATASWGVGTGKIAGRSTGGPSTPTGKNSLIKQIAENPQKFAGKHVSISGRVRGSSKYASNRNLYRLTDGQYSLLVLDDKETPIEYAQRWVAGTVKVVKPPLGKSYAYVVSVKRNPDIDLKWTDVKTFFGEKYNVVKKGVKTATH
jgi:hypothetical protein